ncbi:hypothetical protein LSH36_304g05049, partial [Paralvinella palmiformis]
MSQYPTSPNRQTPQQRLFSTNLSKRGLLFDTDVNGLTLSEDSISENDDIDTLGKSKYPTDSKIEDSDFMQFSEDEVGNDLLENNTKAYAREDPDMNNIHKDNKSCSLAEEDSEDTDEGSFTDTYDTGDSVEDFSDDSNMYSSSEDSDEDISEESEDSSDLAKYNDEDSSSEDKQTGLQEYIISNSENDVWYNDGGDKLENSGGFRQISERKDAECHFGEISRDVHSVASLSTDRCQNDEQLYQNTDDGSSGDASSSNPSSNDGSSNAISSRNASPCDDYVPDCGDVFFDVDSIWDSIKQKDVTDEKDVGVDVASETKSQDDDDITLSVLCTDSVTEPGQNNDNAKTLPNNHSVLGQPSQNTTTDQTGCIINDPEADDEDVSGGERSSADDNDLLAKNTTNTNDKCSMAGDMIRSKILARMNTSAPILRNSFRNKRLLKRKSTALGGYLTKDTMVKVRAECHQMSSRGSREPRLGKEADVVVGSSSDVQMRHTGEYASHGSNDVCCSDVGTITVMPTKDCSIKVDSMVEHNVTTSTPETSANFNTSTSYNELCPVPPPPVASQRTRFSTSDSSGNEHSASRLQKKIVVEKQEAKQERKRARIMEELLYTETTYQRHLDLVVKYFETPLQTNGVLPPDIVAMIFSNIRQIIRINQELMNHLRSLSIGEAFLKLGPFLKLYSTYAKGHERALTLLMVSEAVSQVAAVANHINDHIKQQDNFMKMLAIQKSLSGPSAPKLLVPGRMFIKEGRLKKLRLSQVSRKRSQKDSYISNFESPKSTQPKVKVTKRNTTSKDVHETPERQSFIEALGCLTALNRSKRWRSSKYSSSVVVDTRKHEANETDDKDVSEPREDEKMINEMISTPNKHQTSGMSALDTMSPVLGDQSAALHYNDVWKLEDTMLSTSSASSSTDPVISTDNSYLKDNNKDQSKFSSGQLPNKSTTPGVRHHHPSEAIKYSDNLTEVLDVAANINRVVCPHSPLLNYGAS